MQKKCAANVLPPVCGTMFIVGPPTSGFAEAAGRGHRDFRGVLDVLPVARHAAAVERRAGVEAVHLHAALVAAAAAAAEHDHPGRELHVAAMPPPLCTIDGIRSMTPA